jgi:hypothetical protein
MTLSETKWTPQFTQQNKVLSLEKYYSKYAEKLSNTYIQLVAIVAIRKKSHNFFNYTDLKITYRTKVTIQRLLTTPIYENPLVPVKYKISCVRPAVKVKQKRVADSVGENAVLMIGILFPLGY